MRRRGGTNPLAVVVRFAPRRETLAVTRAIAFHDAPELVPIDLSKLPIVGLGVMLELWIRKCEIDRLRLRNRLIHKTLTKLVVTLPLDAPPRELFAIRRLGVVRPEHHER